MKNNPETPTTKEIFEELFFSRTQQIRKLPGESSEQLHERLRKFVTNRFKSVRAPTKIKTSSWYTFDLSKIGIENGVAICTSTCKHETPLQIFIGLRKNGWMKNLTEEITANRAREGESVYEYTLHPLDRELTEEEKDEVYNLM